MSGGLRRVVVTGLGLVTPLGSGAELVWERLLNGRCGIVSLKALDGFSGVNSKVAGLVTKGKGEGEFDPESVIPDPKVEFCMLTSYFFTYSSIRKCVD